MQLVKSRRHHTLVAAVGFCGALSAVASTARAAGAEPTEPAERPPPRVITDVVNVVSGSRSTVFASPRATSAIEEDELRQQPPRTVGDAIAGEEAAVVQRSSYSSASPSLRGFSDGRVLVLVDGIRLNTTTTSTLPGGVTNLNLVDPYTVRGIELVRGPGLPTYGTEGLGGTVQLRTRKPAPIVDSRVDLSGGLRAMYNSPDNGFHGSVSGGISWKRFAIDTAFSARRISNLTGGAPTGTQPLTGYNEGGLYLGAELDLGSGGNLIAVFQGVRQYDAIRGERSRVGDLLLLSEVARDLAYVRYNKSVDVGSRSVDIAATVSYQRQGETAARQKVDNDRVFNSRNLVDVLGVSARTHSELGRGGALEAGADGYFEWVTSTMERRRLSDGPAAISEPLSQLARYATGTRAQSFGVYLQDELDLEYLFRGKPATRPGRVKALIGARGGATFLQLGADGRIKALLPTMAGDAAVADQEARLVVTPTYGGSFHLRYEPVAGFSMSAGFLTGVRAPNVDDYARLDSGRPGLLLPTRETLAPEAAYSGEFGVRTAYRRIEATAYYAFSHVSSLVVLAPTTVGGLDCTTVVDGVSCERFLRRLSSGPAQLHSVEAAMRLYLFWGLYLRGNVSYTHGSFLAGSLPATSPGPTAGAASEPSPLPRIPPVNGVAALEMRRPRSIFSFAEVAVTWAGPQPRLAVQDAYDPTVCVPGAPPCNGSRGFLVVALRGSLRLTDQLHVSGAIDNVVNDSYRYHGSGVDGPGVGANVALEGIY